MFSYMRKWFISGILVWLPIVVTIVVIKFVLDMLNQSLLLLPPHFQPDVLLGVHVPGIGVVLTLGVILATGVFAANFIGSKLVDLADSLMARIPLVRTIYLGVKQVTKTVFTPGGQSFRKVWLVEYPRKNMWTIAFQTGVVSDKMKGLIGYDEMISIYVPTTPNPTSGFLLMVPHSELIELDISVDQALKLVISLGVVQPKELFEEKQESEQKNK